MLAVLLVFGGNAFEFVHLFSHHQDTVHHQCGDGELSFESEHHHCTFLSFSLAPFITQDVVHVEHYKALEYFTFQSPVSETEHRQVHQIPSFRGPPAHC